MHNWRDYGGRGAVPGGRLFRSAAPTNLSDSQRQMLERVCLGAVVDLRGPSECRLNPAFWPGFAVPTFLSEVETSGIIAFSQTITGQCDSATARRVMLQLYTEQPYRPGLLPAYRAYFRTLASCPGPVLVYCSAGKDRTGLAVALLQHMLGIDRDEVMREYLRSNEAGISDSTRAVLQQLLQTRFNITATLDGLITFGAVSADYLNAALDTIRARSGSIEAYLEHVLGITLEVRTAIRKNLRT